MRVPYSQACLFPWFGTEIVAGPELRHEIYRVPVNFVHKLAATEHFGAEQPSTYTVMRLSSVPNSFST